MLPDGRDQRLGEPDVQERLGIRGQGSVSKRVDEWQQENDDEEAVQNERGPPAPRECGSEKQELLDEDPGDADARDLPIGSGDASGAGEKGNQKRPARRESDDARPEVGAKGLASLVAGMAEQDHSIESGEENESVVVGGEGENGREREREPAAETAAAPVLVEDSDEEKAEEKKLGVGSRLLRIEDQKRAGRRQQPYRKGETRVATSEDGDDERHRQGPEECLGQAQHGRREPQRLQRKREWMATKSQPSTPFTTVLQNSPVRSTWSIRYHVQVSSMLSSGVPRPGRRRRHARAKQRLAAWRSGQGLGRFRTSAARTWARKSGCSGGTPGRSGGT